MASEALRSRPLLRTVLGKTLSEQRRSLMWWGLGLFVAGATYAPFYPSIKDNAEMLNKYMNSMPDFLKEAFLGATGDFTSPAGYLNTELFNFFAPLLLILFAVGAGARAIAGEEEKQTLDILLSTPTPRRRIVIDKFGAMLVASVLISALLWLSVPVTGPPFGLNASLVDLTAAVFMCFLLAMAFGAIALAIGAATGRRALAVGVTAGIAGGTYLLDLLVPAIKSIEFLQLLSPFHYYLGAEPMMRGLDIGGSLVLAAIAIVAFAAALVLFERRDLAA
ncbi:MAG: ABC transporter permease subunit [Solirubrobacterales bacterium]